MKALWQLLRKKKKYQELKESIRMTNSESSDTEKINLIAEGKKLAFMRLLNKIKLLIKV